jgi:hypothetical protein
LSVESSVLTHRLRRKLLPLPKDIKGHELLALDFDVLHPHPGVRSRDEYRATICGHHGTRGSPRPLGGYPRSEDRDVKAMRDAAGKGPRGLKRPVVASPYEVDDVASRSAPVDPAIIRRTGPEPAALRKILWMCGDRLPALGKVEQLLEQWQSSSDALHQH